MSTNGKRKIDIEPTMFVGSLLRVEDGSLLDEEVALDGVGGQFYSSVVGVHCLVETACARKKIGAGRVVGLEVCERH
jgi:hypothetical protein